MSKIPDIPSELFTAFNDVIYYDEPHKYFVGDKELTSVTTLIHKYASDFESQYWSERKAVEFGVSPELVLEGWEFINERATFKGSAIHDYSENRFLNKVFPYPKQKIVNHFGYDAVWDEYKITKQFVDNFYNDSKGKLIPIRTEFVVFCIEYFIGGMVDMLFYNKKSGKFEIWDWKTNKKYRQSSKYPMKSSLSSFSDCEQIKYSLQLSIYKYIIEKYCNIELGDSYLVWFCHKNDNYKIYKAYDYKEYVPRMFKDHKFGLIV